MKVRLVVTISNIDPPVPSYRVRINSLGWCDAMLPLFLHLSVHDKQRIMRQVDRYLPLHISIIRGAVFGVFWHDAANAEFPCHAEGERTYDGTGTEIGKVVAMVPDGFLRSVVAVDESRVWRPLVGTLVPQLLAARVACLYTVPDLLVDCLLYFGSHSQQLRRDSANILDSVSSSGKYQTRNYKGMT